MKSDKIRQLSPEELTLVCGGSQGSSNSDGGDIFDLPPVPAEPDPGTDWDWDPVDWGQYDDPWDQPDYGNGGDSGGGGESHTSSGLGGEVDQLINASPAIESLLNAFFAKGLSISYSQLGALNGSTLQNGNIVIDIDSKDNSMLTFMTLVHELGHFEHAVDFNGYPQRNEYVDAYLTSEGYAMITQIEVINQLQESGTPLNGYNFQADPYVRDQMNAIYSQIGSTLTEAQAAYQIGQIYGNNYNPDTEQTIREDYGDAWDSQQPH